MVYKCICIYIYISMYMCSILNYLRKTMCIWCAHTYIMDIHKLCMYAHKYLYICTYVYTYTCVYIYRYVCMYVHMCVCVNICMFACLHVCRYVHMYECNVCCKCIYLQKLYACMCVCWCVVYVCIKYIYMHIYI